MPAIGSSSSRMWARRQRAGQLDALLQAVGQAADRRLADVWISRKSMTSSTLMRCSISSRCARAPVERVLQEVALHLEVAPGHDVVEHAHALEQRDVLEGAGDALLGRLWGSIFLRSLPLKKICLPAGDRRR
jgi:hypothetical protein